MCQAEFLRSSKHQRKDVFLEEWFSVSSNHLMQLFNANIVMLSVGLWERIKIISHHFKETCDNNISNGLGEKYWGIY